MLIPSIMTSNCGVGGATEVDTHAACANNYRSLDVLWCAHFYVSALPAYRDRLVLWSALFAVPDPVGLHVCDYSLERFNLIAIVCEMRVKCSVIIEC